MASNTNTVASSGNPTASDSNTGSASINSVAKAGRSTATGTASAKSATKTATQHGSSASGSSNLPIGGAGITIAGFTTVASIPIPSSALSSTSGTDAILAALPLATQAGVSYTAASSLAQSLGAAAEGAVSDAAATGLEDGIFTASALAEEIEMIDMGTIDLGSAKVLQAAVDPLENFMNLAQDWLQDLAAMLIKKAAKHPTLALISSAIALDQVGPKLLLQAITAIKNLKPGDEQPTKIPTSTAPSTVSTTQSTSTSSATSNEFLILTNQGTSMSAFKLLTQSLDGGQGTEIAYPHVSFQGYVTNLTEEDAARTQKNPIVNAVVVNEPLDDDTNMGVVRTHQNVPRAQISSLPNSADDLKLISQSQADNIGVNGHSPQYPPPMADYTFDTSLGQGSSIYVIDNGFFKDTLDILIDRYHVVDRNLMRLNRPTDPAQQILAEPATTPHGTCVASVAAGNLYGVARKATLIPVKYKDSARAMPAAILDAWTWAINDAQANNQRAVINYSQGQEANSPEKQAIFDPLFTSILNSAWAADVVTVVAAGNDGLLYGELGNFVPTRLGGPNSPLITVGGTYNNGYLWEATRPQNGGPGSIDIYAQAYNVTCASSTDPHGSRIDSGTSFAAPAVAGLAAYFLQLPELQGQLNVPGQVAMNVKKYLIQRAYERRPSVLDPGSSVPRSDVQYTVPQHILVAYNGARDGMCAYNPAANPKRGLDARDAVCSIPATSSGPATTASVSQPDGSSTIQPTPSSASTPASSAQGILSVSTATTAQTTPITAPAITITAASIPSCSAGTATYSLEAEVSAPADAASIAIDIPVADQASSQWTVWFTAFVVDPADDIANWGVSDEGGVISSGTGGTGISWKKLDSNTGTVLGLEFKSGLGTQTYPLNLNGTVPCTVPSTAPPAPPPPSTTTTALPTATPTVVKCYDS
ncbi:hypothetical protein P7C71_g3279, partial [Lecanoromycetidae sp. Uapishka_2]